MPECPSCHVPHHLECWMENKGCSVPGCSQAPDDESKIVVRGDSIHGQQSGHPTSFVPPPVYRVTPPPIPNHTNPKSRIAFTLLGAILGPLGVHNFYAGYAGKGISQLLITILTCGWGALVTWPWAIIEICVVTQDSNKRLLD